MSNPPSIALAPGMPQAPPPPPPDPTVNGALAVPPADPTRQEQIFARQEVAEAWNVWRAKGEA
jgi:hypothetical protein